jgi:hypothetical protein
MEDLLRRYGLLVRSAGTEIVVLIDNLERCHAEEFEASAREPGRPFGLVFIDKIFEFALRIPTVPASASTEGGVAIAISTSTRGRSETPPPVLARRAYAVEKLAEIESRGRRRGQRRDTTHHLEQLLAELDSRDQQEVELSD